MPHGLLYKFYMVSCIFCTILHVNTLALLQRNQREVEFPSRIEDALLPDGEVDEEATKRSFLNDAQDEYPVIREGASFVAKGVPLGRSRRSDNRSASENQDKQTKVETNEVQAGVQNTSSNQTLVKPEQTKTVTAGRREKVLHPSQTNREQENDAADSDSGSGSANGSGEDKSSGDLNAPDNTPVDGYDLGDPEIPSETYVQPLTIADVALASDPTMDPGIETADDTEATSGSGFYVDPEPGEIITSLDQDLLEKGREVFDRSLKFVVNKRDSINHPDNTTSHRRQEVTTLREVLSPGRNPAARSEVDKAFNTFEITNDQTKSRDQIANDNDQINVPKSKRTEILQPTEDNKTVKRQYIARPHYPFVIRNGYVYLKPPPMTQKTIVTTHIPRPPVMMAYNSFLNKYIRGAFHHQPQMVFEGDEENSDFAPDDAGHCESDPCMNGGTCNEVRDGYECICPTGYKGTDCEEEDKCHPNPCHNGGVCTEANGQYVCTCPQGYKGLNCQEINKCQPTPCHNGGTCNEVNNDYECVCPSEYQGKDCSQINHCHMTPCLNGGTCTSQLGISLAGLVSCLCTPGFSGPRCEMRDRCHINPCKNGGNCRDGSCICINGFSGDICETPPSPCSITPCLNGGSCLVKGLSTYKCICRHGFKGQNCEEESHCDPNPCLNGASCLDTDEGYKCECTHGFKGAHCEDEVSPCDANPCLNDGTCVVEYSRFKCLCKSGYKGTNCEEIDRCHHRPCKNGGICSSEGDDVRCQCLDGYRGLLCEEQDRCFPNPCLNGATCFENSDGFTCSCTAGFRGVHCSERDPCHPNPCHHNSLCISEGEDYHCTCESGWLGANCEDEDHCHPNPCLHGGVCVSRGGSMYECHCPSGFAGLNCEIVNPSMTGTYQLPSSEHTIASAPAVVIACRNTRYGCCPDGETAATGPSAFGCPAFIHSKRSVL